MRNNNRNNRNNFWAAFGARLIDAGFASAASMLVKAFLAPTAGAAVMDVLAGFLAFAFFTLCGYFAFSKNRD